MDEQIKVNQLSTDYATQHIEKAKQIIEELVMNLPDSSMFLIEEAIASVNLDRDDDCGTYRVD